MKVKLTENDILKLCEYGRFNINQRYISTKKPQNTGDMQVRPDRINIYLNELQTVKSTWYLQYLMTAIFTGAVHVTIFGLSILSSDCTASVNRCVCSQSRTAVTVEKLLACLAPTVGANAL